MVYFIIKYELWKRFVTISGQDFISVDMYISICSFSTGLDSLALAYSTEGLNETPILRVRLDGPS